MLNFYNFYDCLWFVKCLDVRFGVFSFWCFVGYLNQFNISFCCYKITPFERLDVDLDNIPTCDISLLKSQYNASLVSFWRLRRHSLLSAFVKHLRSNKAHFLLVGVGYINQPRRRYATLALDILSNHGALPPVGFVDINQPTQCVLLVDVDTNNLNTSQRSATSMSPRSTKQWTARRRVCRLSAFVLTQAILTQANTRRLSLNRSATRMSPLCVCANTSNLNTSHRSATRMSPRFVFWIGILMGVLCAR